MRSPFKLKFWNLLFNILSYKSLFYVNVGAKRGSFSGGNRKREMRNENEMRENTIYVLASGPGRVMCVRHLYSSFELKLI